jgi:hypothetical protein
MDIRDEDWLEIGKLREFNLLQLLQPDIAARKMTSSQDGEDWLLRLGGNRSGRQIFTC